MLNLRSVLVLVAAGLCLWGLFSLLSHLKEPGLLRSEKATVVKGCDDVSEAERRKICAPLFCQKALLDRKEVPWNARFTLQQKASYTDGTVEVVTGHTDQQVSFACAVRGAQVLAHLTGAATEIETFAERAERDPSSLVGTQQ